ncbi:MAG TPA: hypothetical protein VFI95_23920 [Terriglobales bacterium]|nr:hypothetical protein [Terriglobales bacterium]
MSPRVAIIAALEREVRPLVRRWRVLRREHDGRQFKFFESQRAVLVCGGIGPESARRATEAAITLYNPEAVISVGFAGALDPALKAGSSFEPHRVVDASDGSSFETGSGFGTLVSFAVIAGAAQKTKLATAYSAQAVDMEAAAVARGAQTRGLPFSAFKAISDEYDFDMPMIKRFISHDGQFKAMNFVAALSIRPWLWPRTIQLDRNSSRASKVICQWLNQYNDHPESLENKPAELHPIKRLKS